MLTIDELKDGDTFYECESGFNAEFTAVGNPFRVENGWAIMALPAEGETPIEFYCRDGYEMYQKLYWYKEYV